MDADDYSDLTSIDSDDEEYAAKPKAKSSKKKKSGNKSTGYKIKNALKVPRATTYTAQALYEQILNADINLEPEYQRDVVWPEKKQIGLIDSVFRNFYIPPVIFAVQSNEDGSETRTCIDGKQRLTSIHRFMAGMIPHRDPITGEKLYYKDDGASKNKRSRQILPEKYRRLFANKQIVCVEYQDITSADEREIFQRVQLGMALTPAEKLQVINGPNATFIRSLQNTYLKDDSLLGGNALEWDQSRGSDFRCIAQAVICILNPKSNGPSINQIEKYLHSEEPSDAKFKKAMTDTFSILSHLVQTESFYSKFNTPSKISPVEFIMMLVATYHWKEKLTFAQLADGLGKMREDVRKQHVDVRMNGRVMKGLMDFIKNHKPAMADKGQVAGVAVADLRLKRPTEREDASDSSGSDDSDEESEEDEDAFVKPAKKQRRGPPLEPAKPPRLNIKPSSAATITANVQDLSPMPMSANSTTSSMSIPLAPPAKAEPPASQSTSASTPTTMMAPPLPNATRTHPDRMSALRAARERAAAVTNSQSASTGRPLSPTVSAPPTSAAPSTSRPPTPSYPPAPPWSSTSPAVPTSGVPKPTTSSLGYIPSPQPPSSVGMAGIPLTPGGSTTMVASPDMNGAGRNMARRGSGANYADLNSSGPPSRPASSAGLPMRPSSTSGYSHHRPPSRPESTSGWSTQGGQSRAGSRFGR